MCPPREAHAEDRTGAPSRPPSFSVNACSGFAERRRSGRCSYSISSNLRPEPQGHRSLRPSFSESSLSPCTTRKAALHVGFRGEPLAALPADLEQEFVLHGLSPSRWIASHITEGQAQNHSTNCVPLARRSCPAWPSRDHSSSNTWQITGGGQVHPIARSERLLPSDRPEK